MFDFSHEGRDDLASLFDSLCHSRTQMNQLPHEMVAMFTSKGDTEGTERFKAFWADYLEHLAHLVREVSPLHP